MTFGRVTSGLPESSLGRIGLDWYRKNPNVVYALVDCEKIGSADPNEPFAGITGENAEVGARLTRIVDDGPAAKAGLKTGDIIMAVEDKAVVSYQALLEDLRARKPDDVVKIQASRDRELLELTLTLGKRPESDAKPYTAYLGGQRANIQDQQGESGFQFGGVYRSDDAGLSWKRVNSLNPRPMYFSAIRVDPSDDNNVYVMGVSLHASTDAGKTFNDTAGRGTHADHHTMWINPGNGRHIMLGNDGGFYMTYDQGKSWDHFNHMALGQFYHVAVDNRPAYNVYGGLQDNGSWGGPARIRSGSGPVNVDWFRIGSGDGFVCAVDPEDPNQLYYSSQNGGTGWRNLATGQSGSIRPPREQGLTFRFNWRTPFMLSSHNSKIYYVAGNYVFRSYKGGRELWRISPEISRTDKGSGTAIAESPFDPRILYAGTDDGALWATRDGGHTWNNLFEITGTESETPPTAGILATNTPVATPADPAPRGPGAGPGARGGGARFAEMLAQADANGDGLIQKSEMPERMQQMFERLDTDGSGAIDKAELEAAATRGFGRRPQQPGDEPTDPPAAAATPAPPLEPHDEAQPPAEPAATVQPAPSTEQPAAAQPAAATETPAQPAPDTVSGTWRARMIGDTPRSMGTFDITLKLADGTKVSGDVSSEVFSGPIGTGSYDPAASRVRFVFSGERGELVFSAKIDGSKMTGDLTFAGGEFSMPFEA